MSDQDKQYWPAAKIQRRLRAAEALIEMVRAQRVFLASRAADRDALATNACATHSTTRPSGI